MNHNANLTKLKAVLTMAYMISLEDGTPSKADEAVIFDMGDELAEAIQFNTEFFDSTVIDDYRDLMNFLESLKA